MEIDPPTDYTGENPEDAEQNDDARAEKLTHNLAVIVEHNRQVRLDTRCTVDGMFIDR